MDVNKLILFIHCIKPLKYRAFKVTKSELSLRKIICECGPCTTEGWPVFGFFASPLETISALLEQLVASSGVDCI